MIARGASLLALAVALLGVGKAAEAQTFRYCAFGDSNTCGSFDGSNCPGATVDPLHPSSGYPARLRHPSRLHCPVDGSTGCMIYNYGLGGERTLGGVSRIDSVLDQQDFDVVLLMLGTNDVFVNISNSTIRANLQAIEEKAKARGVDTVFASIIRFHSEGSHGHGHGKDAQIEQLKNDLAVIAASRGRWFANPWSLLCPTQGCFDAYYAHPIDNGIHPNASGYDLLANAFQAGLQQTPVPVAPALLSPGDGSVTDSSTVSWQAASHATWYQVQWDGGVGQRWVDGHTACNHTTSVCSWTLPDLATGIHSWRVRARNPRGRGGWSATWSFNLVSSLPAIRLAFTPGTLDFGVLEVGAASGPEDATLENTGELPATGLAFELAGGEGFDAVTGGCPGTLAAGASCTVGVAFEPVEAGPAAGRLVVSSDDGARGELRLSGHGVADGAGLLPAALEVDPEAHLSDGNRVLEPGETAAVAPAWRNDEPTSRALAGTAADLAGPDGADYSLELDAADYGDIDPGETMSCVATGLCYRMGVDDPAIRPALHWDATFREIPSDDAAEEKVWSLHIGDSFLDVPRSSPFYRAVEGVLHHGITAGCSAAEYCPAQSNSRAQMAVFLLRAFEGPDYSPPPCVPGAERFADVPAEHPLCPWVEDLASREVTTGCGDGRYCPNDPVTRSAMAVFLLRTLEGPAYLPPSCTKLFADVRCPSPVADWIEALYTRGIAAGCAADPAAYCPDLAVTRAQMAAFLAGTFGITPYGP